MADIAGEEIPNDPVILENACAFASGDLANPFPPVVAGAAFAYLMEGKDNVTGEVRTWPSTTRDFTGVDYTGPNEPVSVAVAATRVLAD